MNSYEKSQKRLKTAAITSAVVFVVITWVMLSAYAAAAREDTTLLGILGNPSSFLPLGLFRFLDFGKGGISGGAVGASAGIGAIVGLLAAYFMLTGKSQSGDMRGIEQGSAKWMVNVHEGKNGKPQIDAADMKKYQDRIMDKWQDMIMYDNTYGISMNTRKTQRNLHMLVVGGSGAGKTRFFIKPNILQMNCSYIITDPSGELYRDMGQMLINNGYDVRVFNTFNTRHSMQYNPLAYIDDDADVTALITTLIKNTGEATGDNKYFDDATKLLLSAIILFLYHYCPKSEQDFAHVMKLVVAADVPEGVKNPKSDLDRIFEEVEKVDKNGLALKMYKSFKSTSGKSLKAVLSSTATRLTVFNYGEIERLTCTDTISLKTIGDEKTALFIITPPVENGFGFLVAMMYSQLFSKLYSHAQFDCHYLLTDDKLIARPFKSREEAEHVYNLLMKDKEQDEKHITYKFNEEIGKYTMYEITEGGTEVELLKEVREDTMKRFQETPEQFHIKQNTKSEAGSPFHVRMLMDEFANINQIPSFEQILSTIRKYNISIVIVLQGLSQLEKLYKEDFETIIGNCDSFVFLGANDTKTAEYISKKLGEKTITVEGAGDSLNGKGPMGHSHNYGQQKRALMLPDELTLLPSSEQIVMLREYHPMRLHKYNLEAHPNYGMSAEGGGCGLLNLEEAHDLEKKYRELAEKNGGEGDTHTDTGLTQEEINDVMRRPWDAWMSGKPDGASENPGTGGKTDDMDFF